MKPYLFQMPEWLPFAPGRPIFSYGIMLGIAFIAGWSLCVHLSRRDGFSARTASMGMFVIVVTSMLGSRFLHYLSSPTAQLSLVGFFKFDEGGLVAWGGILGAVVGSYVYLRVLKKCDWWAYADNAAPPLALGLGITRIGCFLFGCDYGVRSDTALAVRFPRWDDPGVHAWLPRSAPAYADHHPQFDHTSVFSDLVHPTQLYEALVGILAFGVLLLWLHRKRFHGQIMLLFLGYYAVLRFLLETIRGDGDRNEDFWGVGLSTSQAVGVLVLVAVAVLWWLRSRRGLYSAAGTVTWSRSPEATKRENDA